MNSKLTLNLDKSANALRLALDKAGVVANVKAETAAIIDVSGSFEHEHEEGTTSILIERLVPYCMVLDPDRKMDVFTFSAGEESAHYVGAVTPDDARDYVTRNIVDRVPRRRKRSITIVTPGRNGGRRCMLWSGLRFFPLCNLRLR